MADGRAYALNKSAFTNDFDELQTKRACERVSLDDAYKFYLDTHARVTTKNESAGFGVNFHVFGRHAYSKEASLKDRVVYVPDQSGKVGIGSEEFANLPVLLQGKWTIAINDTWLVAGVNSRAEFHAFGQFTWADVESHDEHIVTVTGRELIGLALAGYKEEIGGQGEKIYISQPLTTYLSLVDYDEEVSALTKSGVDKIKDFFAGKGFTF